MSCVQVGGWESEQAAKDGATKLAAAIRDGFFDFELLRRSIQVDRTSFGTVQVGDDPVVDFTPVPTPAPIEEEEPLLSDPAVLAAIIGAGVVVLLALGVMLVVVFCVKKDQTVTPADMAALPSSQPP